MPQYKVGLMKISVGFNQQREQIYDFSAGYVSSLVFICKCGGHYLHSQSLVN